MEENEIQIGHKKIGMSTEITFTVKTLFYILGILFTFLTALFTWFYFNTQDRESKLRSEMSAQIKEYHTDVKRDIKSLEGQIFTLATTQNGIHSDIRTIINRQIGAEGTPSESRNLTPITPTAPR